MGAGSSPVRRITGGGMIACGSAYIIMYIYIYTSTLVYTYIAVYVMTFSLLTCLADQARMPCARRQRQVISLTNNQMPHWMSCAACVGTTFGLRLRAHRLRPPDVPKYGFVDKFPNAKRHPEKARHARYSGIGTTPQMQNEHLQSKDDVPYLARGISSGALLPG